MGKKAYKFKLSNMHLYFHVFSSVNTSLLYCMLVSLFSYPLRNIAVALKF